MLFSNFELRATVIFYCKEYRAEVRKIKCCVDSLDPGFELHPRLLYDLAVKVYDVFENNKETDPNHVWVIDLTPEEILRVHHKDCHRLLATLSLLTTIYTW